MTNASTVNAFLIASARKHLSDALRWQEGMVDQYVPPLIAEVLADLDKAGFEIVRKKVSP